MEGTSQQFTATTLDQFGQAMATQPGSFTWSLGTGSVGTLSSAGIYQAPATSTGTATVIASYGMSGSATVTVTALATIPAAPTNLVASVISKNQINLSWSESSNNVTGYNVQRSSNGGKSWVQLAQVTTTSYSDITANGGKTYQYRVDAYNSAGSSAWTTSGNVVTPKVLLVSGATPASLFGSSSGQDAMTSGSGLTQLPPATILDYFLAPLSSAGSGDKRDESFSLVDEQPAQQSEPATTGASDCLTLPASVMNALDPSGELPE
jgi:hypothetical protein